MCRISNRLAMTWVVALPMHVIADLVTHFDGHPATKVRAGIAGAIFPVRSKAACELAAHTEW